MTSTADAPDMSQTALVTRGIVKLHSASLGRGPQSARSEWIGADGLICTMRGVLTQVELTLVERGFADQVHALRRSFQEAMAPEFTAVVEGATGRRVVAFLSETHLDPDISTEIFYFAPLDP
jgi:uncharacterized protein YbcI